MAVDDVPEPSAPPAPSAPAEPQPNPKLEKLQQVLNRFEIAIAEASELAALQDFNIVVIADDSGSMSMACSQEGGLFQRRTRWDELRSTVGEVLELAACLVERIDVFFLNRPPVLDVKIGDVRLDAVFDKPPSGTTPLTRTLNQVVEQVGVTEKPVLVMIATDGEPDEGIAVFTRTVTDLIYKRSTTTTFKFQILACTDDDNSIAWLDDFDRAFKEVDVTDDYYSERRQILAAGKVKTFGRFDYVAKALLGPICTRFDSLDEPKEKGDNVFIFFAILIFLLAFLFK